MIDWRTCATSVVAVAILALGGCAPKVYGLSPTSLTPASTGVVEADVDDNGNRVLTLEVDHLPEPSELGEGLSTFVVWVRPGSGEQFRNQGGLVIDEDRQGTLEFKVPYDSMDVKVTAEADAAALEPGEHVLLEGSVEMDGS